MYTVVVPDESTIHPAFQLFVTEASLHFSGDWGAMRKPWMSGCLQSSDSVTHSTDSTLLLGERGWMDRRPQELWPFCWGKHGKTHTHIYIYYVYV